MSMTLEYYGARAAKLTLSKKGFIDDNYCSASDEETFPTLNPSTGEEIVLIVHCTGDDVDRAVKVARRAFNEGSWSRTAPEDRKEVMLRLAELGRENAERLIHFVQIVLYFHKMWRQINPSPQNTDGV